MINILPSLTSGNSKSHKRRSCNVSYYCNNNRFLGFERLEDRSLLSAIGITSPNTSSETSVILESGLISENLLNESVCQLDNEGDCSSRNVNSPENATYIVSEDTIPVTFSLAKASEGSEPLIAASAALSGSLTEEETFSLHSLTGSDYTIYLDFTGHITSGTQWNTTYNSGADIVTPVYDLDGDPTTFSAEELAAIYEIWQRVSEDYLPFNVDVTTEEPALDKLMRTDNDSAYGIRVCIGGSSYDWYKSSGQSAVGGIAYDRSFTSTKDLPCFVFTESLQNQAKYIAESATHEAGHTLCLSHDGQGVNAYYQGTSSWAPIMGIGYYSELTQWSKGDYSNATNTENDLQILANMLGTRSDDYADDFSNAYDLGTLSNSTSISGLVGLNWKNISGTLDLVSDLDVFSFSTDSMKALLRIGRISGITNLNAKVSLYDSNENLLEIFDSESSFYVLIDLSELSGSYYLTIKGAGFVDAGTEETGYASLGAYTISVVDDLPDLYFTQTNTLAAEVFLSSDSTGKTKQTVFSNDKAVYVFFALTNSGSKDVSAGAYKVRLYYNDKIITALSGTSLDYGQIIRKGFYVYDPSNPARCSISSTGTYLFKAMIIYDDAELSKINNSVEFTFEIHDPWTTTVNLTAVELGANTPNHSPAGTFTAIDPWCKDFTFSLADDGAGELANSNFSFSGNQLILESALEAGSYIICVRSTSSSGYSVLNRFTITVSELANISPKALLTVSCLTPQEGTRLFLSSAGSSDSEDGTELTRQWRIFNSADELQKTIVTKEETVVINVDDYALPLENFTVDLTVFDSKNAFSLTQKTMITVQDSLPTLSFQYVKFDNISLIKLNLDISAFFKKNYSSLTINWGDQKEVYEIKAFQLSLIHYYSEEGDYQISLSTNNGLLNFNLTSYTLLYPSASSASSKYSPVSNAQNDKISFASEISEKVEQSTDLLESQGLTDSQIRLLAIHLLESSSNPHKKQICSPGNTF